MNYDTASEHEQELLDQIQMVAYYLENEKDRPEGYDQDAQVMYLLGLQLELNEVQGE